MSRASQRRLSARQARQAALALRPAARPGNDHPGGLLRVPVLPAYIAGGGSVVLDGQLVNLRVVS